MLSKTLRPHRIAATALEKVSSRRRISDASFATSVPVSPIAKPTSAAFSAAASLVPSPVTATTSRRPPLARLFWIPVTRSNLCAGDARASTLSFGHRSSNASRSIAPLDGSRTDAQNASPVVAASSRRASSSSSSTPHFRATAIAVGRLSPVTTMGRTPASEHRRMASGTSGRSGSSMPTAAMRVSPRSHASTSRLSSGDARGSKSGSKSRNATSITRIPSSDHRRATSRTNAASRGSCETPSAARRVTHSGRTSSTLPLTYMRYPSASDSEAAVLALANEHMRLLSGVNGRIRSTRHRARSDSAHVRSPRRPVANCNSASSVRLPERSTVWRPVVGSEPVTAKRAVEFTHTASASTRHSSGSGASSAHTVPSPTTTASPRPKDGSHASHVASGSALAARSIPKEHSGSRTIGSGIGSGRVSRGAVCSSPGLPSEDDRLRNAGRHETSSTHARGKGPNPRPAAHTLSTVMRFCVSVPVLSVQMHVALPAVSHAPRYRTRLLSCNMRRTLNASARVTARGKPSGTATTTTVAPTTTKPRYSRR